MRHIEVGWSEKVQVSSCPDLFTCVFCNFPSVWLQTGQQLVSQLQGLFWSFQIKHDPLPLILFATRSVTVILSTTNRLLQHTMKSTPDQVAMGSHGITHRKSVNKRRLLYLTLSITLSKKVIPKSTLFVSPTVMFHCQTFNIYDVYGHIVHRVTGCKNKYSSLKGQQISCSCELVVIFFIFFISK